jgi:hypothetical protein
MLQYSQRPVRVAPIFMSSSEGDQDGADLAAAFFKIAQEKGVNLEAQDLTDDDDDEEENDDEDYEDDTVLDALIGEQVVDDVVSLTDDQLYSEVKERVLDTAGGFIQFVTSVNEDEDDEDAPVTSVKLYEPPTTVPGTSKWSRGSTCRHRSSLPLLTPIKIHCRSFLN